jgi:ankyrin repeat protein
MHATYNGCISIIRRLIALGAAINIQNKVSDIMVAQVINRSMQDGQTALMLTQDLDITSALLAAGASVNIQNKVSDIVAPRVINLFKHRMGKLL